MRRLLKNKKYLFRRIVTKRKWLRALHEIHETTQVFMEMSSSRSPSARMKSGVSVIARKQSKVAAARAKIKFSEQERNIMKQKIKLDEDDLWASMS